MMILPDKKQIRAVLGDLLVNTTQYTQDVIDEEALLNEIEVEFRDLPPVTIHY